jgi:hypothetical protein
VRPKILLLELSDAAAIFKTDRQYHTADILCELIEEYNDATLEENSVMYCTKNLVFTTSVAHRWDEWQKTLKHDLKKTLFPQIKY